MRRSSLAVGQQFYIIPLYAMKSVNLVNPEITGIRQIPGKRGAGIPLCGYLR